MDRKKEEHAYDGLGRYGNTEAQMEEEEAVRRHCELTMMVPPTNIRYQMRSSLRGNRGLPISSWLRYE